MHKNVIIFNIETKRLYVCLEYLNVSVCATLQFTYVDTYPDDAPVIEVPSYEGMDDSDVENLREFLEQEVIF